MGTSGAAPTFAFAASFLGTLGVRPIAGRNFTAEDDRPNASHAAILSYGLWQSRFGGDGRVGKTLPLDGESATIVGVPPPSFELPGLERADVLVPQALHPAEPQRAVNMETLNQRVGKLAQRPRSMPCWRRLLRAFLFHVSSGDLWMVGPAIAVLSGTALAAAWIPSRVDPMAALRAE